SRTSEPAPRESRRSLVFARGVLLRLVVHRRQLLDLEVARAGGRGDFDFVALFAAHEAAAYGRGGGDESSGGVALFGRDESVGDYFLALRVVEYERGAVGGAVVRYLREVNRGEFAEALAQLLHARLNVLLARERGVILGVLSQVAELLCALDLARQVHVQLLVQLVQLPLELLLYDLCHLISSARVFRTREIIAKE